jgi:uncharacterized cofD-like protein
MDRKKPNVVVIGGGTGTFVVLSGLKIFDVNLSAVVTTMDSGGSAGKLRDQLGILPPGDLRQSLIALSETPDIWRKLFTYRFDVGDLGGHTLGNIFLSALQKITDSPQQAIDEISKILNIKGEVIPVTFSNCTLCARYADGSLIQGEVHIDESYTKRPRITDMYVTPDATLNPKAAEALKNADVIIFGPGDLYTSIIPNLLIDDIAKKISQSKAKKVYVMNLMTKLGQTDDFTSSDHIYELEKYLGSGYIDFVVINTKKPTQEVLDRYKEIDNVVQVEDDLQDKYATDAKIIRTDVLSTTVIDRTKADKVKRSLIRHDPDKLANVLTTIIDKVIDKGTSTK